MIDSKAPNLYQLLILGALNKKSIHNVYMGTVPPSTVRARRIKNRRARKARAITRGDSL